MIICLVYFVERTKRIEKFRAASKAKIDFASRTGHPRLEVSPSHRLGALSTGAEYLP